MPDIQAAVEQAYHRTTVQVNGHFAKQEEVQLLVTCPQAPGVLLGCEAALGRVLDCNYLRRYYIQQCATSNGQ
jgi:hypothetical protein